jgi:hypothetical protein
VPIGRHGYRPHDVAAQDDRKLDARRIIAGGTPDPSGARTIMVLRLSERAKARQPLRLPFADAARFLQARVGKMPR